VCGADTVEADPAMKEFLRGVPVYAKDDDRTAREFLLAIGDQLGLDRVGTGSPAARRAFAVSRYSWHHAVDRYLEIASRLVPQSASSAVPMQASAGEVPR